MGVIYKLDFASGKSYIGLTTRTLVQRLNQHRMDMKNPRRSFLVHSAWLKYGEPVASVIAEAEGEDLKQAERDAIARFNTIAPNGYNLLIGGDIPDCSEETRKKMGDSHRGKVKTPEHKANISAALRGRTISPEHRAKMAESARKRSDKRNDLSKFWVGRKQTEEHKAKKAASKRATMAQKRALAQKDE